MCIGVRKRWGAGNAARLGGTENEVTDSALKGSGNRVSLSQVEIRLKATSERVGGWERGG